MSLRRFQNLQYSLPHQSLEGITFQQRAEYGAAIIFTIVAGLRYNGRGGPPDRLGDADRLLLRQGAAEPVVHAGGIVCLTPKIGDGHAEGTGQLLLLFLGMPALVAVIGDMWAWPVMEQAFHISEQQAARRAEQEGRE